MTSPSQDPVDFGRLLRKHAELERDVRSLLALKRWAAGVMVTLVMTFGGSAAAYLLAEGGRRERLESVERKVTRLDDWRERSERAQMQQASDIRALTVEIREWRVANDQRLDDLGHKIAARRRRAAPQ